MAHTSRPGSGILLRWSPQSPVRGSGFRVSVPGLIARLAGLVLGGVLFAAAVLKAGDTGATVNAVRIGLGVPTNAAEILTTTLIFGEILLGSWLISGFRPRASLIAGVVLFSVFTLWNASFLARGIRADCGCGFSSANPSLEQGQWVATTRAGLFGLIGVVGLVSGVAAKGSEFETHSGKETA